MSRKKLLPMILLLVVCHFLGAFALGQDLNVAPKEGLLVLRSGGIIKGTITRAGGEYYVGVAGGEMRVKADEVELTCADLEEAYRLKAAGLPTGYASEHAELAEWCLRQGLLGYAAKELLQVRATEPNFARLPLLERRLALALQPAEPQVVREAQVAEPETRNELDDLYRRLPPRAVESFTTVVQPLLMNGCAAAACHGPSSNNKLRLERIALGRPASYRISQRNLASVLSCIDPEKPAESPLLIMPLGPHGTAAEAVLTKRDLDKYRQMVAWVSDVTTTGIAPTAEKITPTPAPLLQSPHKSTASRQSGQPNQSPNPILTAAPTFAKSANPAAETPPNESSETIELSGFEQTPDQTSGETIPDIKLDSPSSGHATELPQTLPTPAATMLHQQQQTRRKIQFGAPVKPVEAQDPFDPALFNSQPK